MIPNGFWRRGEIFLLKKFNMLILADPQFNDDEDDGEGDEDGDYDDEDAVLEIGET